ncbi:unnamed protein product [Ectocarpus sp. 12 AP-2014]
MEGRAGSGSASPDEWGSAVTSGDATKLAELVLLWSGLKPERALSILRDCVSLLEKEVAFSGPASPAVPSPTTHGTSHSLCLKALIVTLDETCDGTSWYTSTKELQLASLEFCIECRKCKTLHLKVDATTPRRLLAAADAPPPHPKRLCRTRVPRLRARRVTWNMPTAAELRHPMFALTDVDCLEFDEDFEGSLEAVTWPQRLKRIGFSESFNEPIDLVEWPPSLQEMIFGQEFNQPLERMKFPASLETIIFSEEFNQPIERVRFPASLRQLKIRGLSNFDQPIGGVLPTSLQQLDLGTRFNQPIQDVVWPPSLQKLNLGFVFDHPIQRVVFPASLQELTVNGGFHQPIEGVLWPDSLQRLVLGWRFNRSIDNVRWPASLQEVTFGFFKNEGNSMLSLGSDFNRPVGSSVWPASLQRLTLGGHFRQSLQGLGSWMPHLEALRLLDYHSDSRTSLLRGIEWPKGLRHLTVYEESNLDGVTIPSTAEVLYAHKIGQS